ncbi:hypothetical protein N8T08_008805 [Aspergillus melleus]|uniref:Uncharacterized protein n=1 Tax=Aspergillus melleus TaxID=138277 RepID=A0ACC3AVZ5_9EURO|nr:hypothetical protein N8T08_008805 [Aspergillus melleus]
MSSQFQSYRPVEDGQSRGGRPQSYHPPPPRFYGPPTPKISTPPQSDSLKPTRPVSYRHSHSFSTANAGGLGIGQLPVTMRERSSSHSLYPASLLPGGNSAPSSPRSRSPSYSAYPGAPDRSAPQSQTRERSGSYSPHPVQLQPGSRPSSRPHSPSLSYNGSDELHLGDTPPSSSRQPSPTSSSHAAFPPAPYQTAQQLAPQPQSAENGLSASRERSPSASFSGGYAPYSAAAPQKVSPAPAPAPTYPQHSPALSFNNGHLNALPPSLNVGNPEASNASYYSAPSPTQGPGTSLKPAQAQAQPGPGAAEDGEQGLGTTILGAGASRFWAMR